MSALVRILLYYENYLSTIALAALIFSIFHLNATFQLVQIAATILRMIFD
jgi:hypothetical protein